MEAKEKVFIEPVMISAGSELLRLGLLRKPPLVNCRVLSEDAYQTLKQAYDRGCARADAATSDSGLTIPCVNNLAKFSKMIANQKDCPPEFIDIVNKEFWNLI